MKILPAETGDLLRPHHTPGSSDIVVCSLTLHHFADEDAVPLLQSMNTRCRIGFIVSDLKRSRVAVSTTKLYALLSTTNPVTHTDSCLSFLRGFTPGGVRRMALRAGPSGVTIERRSFFRFILVGKHHEPAGRSLSVIVRVRLCSPGKHIPNEKIRSPRVQLFRRRDRLTVG
jgi:hypothetical protein